MRSFFTTAKKPALRRQLLIIVFVVFSLLILYYFFQSNQKSAFQSQVLGEASLGSPVSLIIPTINVNAHVQHVGVNPQGEMEVPSNTVDVGWFAFGPPPGEKGSAVISGHVDGKNGTVGVFTNLDKLTSGDKIHVIDSLGTTVTFVVKESRTYTPGFADEVFISNDGGKHLNLVTCDGAWDAAKKSYSKRLVVFADSI